MKSLFIVTAAMFFMTTHGALGATPETDDSVSASESAPMVSTKYSSHDNFEKSGISRITPVTGFIVSNFVGDNTSQYNVKVGASLGATMDIGYSSMVFETGLLFRQLGTQTTATNDFSYSTQNVDYTLNYLALPVGGKCYIGGQEGGGVFIKAGVMPQFLISNSTNNSSYYYSYNNNTWTANVPSANSFDFDVYAGIGGKIPINDKIDIMIDGTYSRGLTSMTSSSSGTIYNSALGLSGGVGFAL